MKAQELQDLISKIAREQHKAIRDNEQAFKKVNGKCDDYLFWDNCEAPLREVLTEHLSHLIK